jgi:ferredoxin-NADP reductase
MAENNGADGFARLRVKRVVHETADAVSLVLDIPEHCSAQYRYQAGQFLTLRVTVEGQELRRCYSMSSAPLEDDLQITVKRDPGGVVSNWLNDTVAEGVEIHAAPPEGRFCLRDTADEIVAFAGGSGITPILGIIRNVLLSEPNSRCTLFYGNRTTSTIMFAEDLLALKDCYPGRLALNFILSREPQDIDLFNGRLDAAKIQALAGRLFDPAGTDAYFLCGPGTMIESVHDALIGLGVDAARIHSEHFVSGVAAQQPSARAATAEAPEAEVQMTQVTVVMDGRRRSFSMAPGGATVLEAAERAGLELPYSCRAGVCSTCRTRVVRGSVTMTSNYALEPWELEDGYVLCCQALPTTPELEITYDER